MADEKNSSDKPADDMILLGIELRELREAQGLSYEDVERVIHVRKYAIEAIESGRVTQVMAPVYARGFVKTYCEFLCAHDLWRKYSQHLSMTDVLSRPGSSLKVQAEISHPTPIFPEVNSHQMPLYRAFRHVTPPRGASKDFFIFENFFNIRGFYFL